NNFWRGTANADGVVADDGTVFRVTRPEEKVRPGEGAIAAVRPECFRLDTVDPGRDANVLPGVVASIAHFGDVLQYVVTAGQREIVVLTPRSAAFRLETGDSVWCSWTAEDVYEFSDRQADLVLPVALARQESTTSA
ncbi:MAG TPA: TOBE domain-containing protein, partial [Ilumatobacter sp.]|nr:TOBE domain-containing protein [Ilumatobacter sp.]